MENFASFFVMVFVVAMALAVLIIAAMWKIYVKAGQPGWACIVPIYNVIVMLRIVGKPNWWLLMMCLPVVSFIFFSVSQPLFLIVYLLTGIVAYVFLIWMYNMLSKSFGKEESFTAGLLFLGFIFIPILGFGKAKYLGPYGDPAAFKAHNNDPQFDFERDNMNEGI